MGNSSLTPICSLSKPSLSPSLTAHTTLITIALRQIKGSLLNTLKVTSFFCQSWRFVRGNGCNLEVELPLQPKGVSKNENILFGQVFKANYIYQIYADTISSKIVLGGEAISLNRMLLYRDCNLNLLSLSSY